MNRDGHLELVRTLTLEVMAMARPGKMTTFAGDCAALAISGGLIRAEESLPSTGPGARPWTPPRWPAGCFNS